MNAEMASGITTGWGIMAAGSWHHSKGVPWNIELAAAGLEVDHLGFIIDIYIYTYIRKKHIYIYMWINFITTSLFYKALEMMVNKGNHSLLWPSFRLVNYYN